MNDNDDDRWLEIAGLILDGKPIAWDTIPDDRPADDASADAMRVIADVAAIHRAPEGEPVRRWGMLAIQEQIGHGTFGDVYRARDAALDRDVALKLVDHTPSAPDEGRLLARVRHSNVVTVHGAAIHDGRYGIWMEFIRGRTLAAVVREQGPLAAADVTTIGIDVCRALTAVHESGLLHGDIKPQNVMREDGGRIVVMDFGTGRVDTGGAAGNRLVGTPLYLAPEVLTGAAPDVRADVYGAGVLLYYLLTGAHPVEGRTLDEVRAAHASGARAPVRSRRPDITRPLAAIIERAIAVQPVDRFESAVAFERALRASSAKRTRAFSTRLVALIVVSVLIAVLGGGYWLSSMTGDWNSKIFSSDVWSALHTAAPIPIAVLPLVNVSHDPASDYFADGLTDELIAELSIIDGLAVRSQTSSFVLKGKPRSVREAGTLLRVDYVLQCSVARSGQRVGITAQLVRVSDDVTLWSNTFDRDVTDILAVQEEISRGIVNALRLKLGRVRRRYETSVEAYDLYLRARALGKLRYTGAADADAIDLFQKAITKDPSMAPAYAGLAAGYEILSALHPEETPGTREDYLDKMRAAAEKAVQLDPLLAEAQGALGKAYARNGQWDLAESSLRKAIEIAPNLSSSHERLASSFLMPLGRIEEAVREFRAAERNDPLSPYGQYELGAALLSAEQYDQAARQCEKISADIDLRSECLGRALTAQGRASDAVRLLAVAHLGPPSPNPGSSYVMWGYLAYAYAKAGRRTEAEKLMALYPGPPGRPPPVQYALAYAGLGDKDRTIEQLDRVSGVGPVRFGTMLNGPEFAFVRDDPRVRLLRKRVGLPE
jgi:serine/threonine-protein kinase